MQVDCCHFGREGLTALPKGDYQLVVLDLMMPGISGFEALEEIRASSSVPVLMLTAKGDNISKLRKKVEPDPSEPTVIQTVKGVGYRFNKEL